MAFCDSIRDQYGLTMPVLIWQSGQAAADLGFDERHVHQVMERGSKIVFRDQFDDSDFRAEIDRLLAQ